MTATPFPGGRGKRKEEDDPYINLREVLLKDAKKQKSKLKLGEKLRFLD